MCLLSLFDALCCLFLCRDQLPWRQRIPPSRRHRSALRAQLIYSKLRAVKLLLWRKQKTRLYYWKCQLPVSRYASSACPSVCLSFSLHLILAMRHSKAVCMSAVAFRVLLYYSTKLVLPFHSLACSLVTALLHFCSSRLQKHLLSLLLCKNSIQGWMRYPLVQKKTSKSPIREMIQL